MIPTEFLLRHVHDAWALVVAAPAAAILLIGLGYVLKWLWDSRRIAILKERCEALKEEVARYKDKLQGATPEEAKARIDGLESEVAAQASQIANLKSEQERVKGLATLAFISS